MDPIAQRGQSEATRRTRSHSEVGRGEQMSSTSPAATLSVSPEVAGEAAVSLPSRGALSRKLRHASRFYYHWKIRKSTVLPYQPSEVSLELTNRCNYRCAFCPQSNPDHFDRVPASALSPERAHILLSKLRRGGVETGIIHWTLDGEPFMNKSFHEVVKVAVEHGFHTHHFATNAHLMTLDRLHEFPAKGQKYYLTPDFCSDEEFFETHRGKPGSWAIVLENLRAAISDPSLSHFHFKVTDISSYKIADSDDLDERFNALKALFPESDRVGFHRRTFHNAAGLRVVEQAHESSKYYGCPYPWFSFMIASNGDVVACCRDLEHQTVLGNLFRQEVAEIWNGEAYQALRRDLISGDPQKQAACAECDLPYDESKFSWTNVAKTAVHRMLLLEK